MSSEQHRRQAVLCFADNLASMIQDHSVSLLGSFVLDSTKQPKQITIHSSDLQGAGADFLGIYELGGDLLTGDQVTIAWAQGRPAARSDSNRSPDRTSTCWCWRNSPKQRVVQMGPTTPEHSRPSSEWGRSATTAVRAKRPRLALPGWPRVGVHPLMSDVRLLSKAAVNRTYTHELLSAIDRRLNSSGAKKLARVRLLDDGQKLDARVEVALLPPRRPRRPPAGRAAAGNGRASSSFAFWPAITRTSVQSLKRPKKQPTVESACSMIGAMSWPGGCRSRLERKRTSPTTRISVPADKEAR